MKAVIMAGGFGTRIQPLTNSIPKPMLPLFNCPMMEYTIRSLIEAGITEFIVLLYFKPEIIKNYFKDGSQLGINITYVTPDDDYGTAGAVKKAQKHIGKENFIVVSGDLVTDFDFKKIIHHHQAKKSKLTITLTTVDNPLEFGIVVADEDGRIQRFIEKPSWGEVISDTINTGIYIIEPEILDYIPANENYDFAKDLFPLLMCEYITLWSCYAQGYWRDVGNPESYRDVHEDIFNDKISLKLDTDAIRYPNGMLVCKDGTLLDKNVEIIGTVMIGKNVTVENGCRLNNVVIGDNVVIEQNSKIGNSIIWHNVTVGSNAKLDGCIICNDNHIGKNITAKSGMILAEGCAIGDLVTVNKDITIWPHKVIETASTVSSNMVLGNRYKNSIFQYGMVSGQSNVELSCEMATKLAEAFAAQLPVGSTVIVSRDYSHSSRMLKRAVIGGVLSAGVNVIDCNVAPLSVMRYGIQHNDIFAGGIHINQMIDDPTRSVISFFDQQAHRINNETSKKIEKTFFNERFRRVDASKIAQITESDNETEYAEYKTRVTGLLENDLHSGQECRIAVDMAHGISSDIFSAILSQLDVDHIMFNAHPKEPRRFNIVQGRQAINDLEEVVKALNLNAGFLLYPDGQSLEIICEKGAMLSKQTSLYAVLALLDMEAKYEKRIKRVLLPISAADIIHFDHLEIAYGRLGDVNTAIMKTYDLIAVGNGSYAFTEFSIHRDAIYAALKILGMIVRHHVCLSELVDSLPKYYYRTYRIPCSQSMKGTIMRRFLDDAKGKRFSTLDGVKIWLGSDDWILMIPHMYDEHLNITIQASNKTDGEQIFKKYTTKLRKWLKEDIFQKESHV